MSDFGKVVKILQYTCVVKAEFFSDGSTKAKWKLIGSQFSTARMVTRFADWVSNIKFVVSKLYQAQQGQLNFKKESKLKWMMQFCDFMSAIFDNWYFLQKIEIMDPTGRALTDQRCAMFSVAWIILGVIDKLRQMHREANQAEKIGSSGS